MDEVTLREINPQELRKIIAEIPDIIQIPFMNNTMKIDGRLIRLLDMFLYLTGCRVSEVVTKTPRSYESKKLEKIIEPRTTGSEIKFNQLKFGKEDVAVWTITTLKRKTATSRNVAIPLNPDIEPWGKAVALPFKWENPFKLNRHIVYQANCVAFKGLGYWIEPQLVKLRSGEILFEAKKHMKPASDHFLRHVRSRELTVDYGFTDNDLMTFFGWSPVSFGKNPYMQRYQNLRWQDYFPKLLKERRI